MTIAENRTKNSNNEQQEAEAEEEFMMNQIHGLIDFIQTNGSVKKFAERNKPKQNVDQSQHCAYRREQNEKVHLLEASTSLNGAN